MTETDDLEEPKMSPLSCEVTSDGVTVQVDIYSDGKHGWILEVVDEEGASTVWDDIFFTDQSALDEALRVIEEEGIRTFFSDQNRTIH